MVFQNNNWCVLQIQIIKVEFYRSMSTQELSYEQQAEIAGFIAKAFQILSNQEYSKIIYWGASGKEFVIKDINKFQQLVLPRYFRHKKINSFIRQLNMYGFHKSRKDNSKSIFSHPNFLKGREDLLSTIKRKIRSALGSVKTPKKQKQINIQKKSPETAAKEQEQLKKMGLQLSQPVLKGFLDSRQVLHSRFNLSISLKKISMNQLEQECNQNQQQDKDEKISIQFEIQKKDQDFRDLPKILNPSFFFNSFNENFALK